jgi:hypothetical protein
VSRVLLAEFSRARELAAAAQAAVRRKARVLDAFAPFPVEGVAELIGPRPSRIRVMMFIAGAVVAAMAYGGEFYTAAIDYQYNSGGRPLQSWPAFMLVPFATGILGASIGGLATFLAECGLPRLHHPFFGAEGFERASQDRFLLALASPEEDEEQQRVIDLLREAGATAVQEVEA